MPGRFVNAKRRSSTPQWYPSATCFANDSIWKRGYVCFHNALTTDGSSLLVSLAVGRTNGASQQCGLFRLDLCFLKMCDIQYSSLWDFIVIRPLKTIRLSEIVYAMCSAHLSIFSLCDPTPAKTPQETCLRILSILSLRIPPMERVVMFRKDNDFHVCSPFPSTEFASVVWPCSG